MGILEILYILLSLVIFSIAIIIRIFYSKRKLVEARELDIQMTDFLINRFEEIHEEKELGFLKKHKDLFLSRYIKLSQSTLLTDAFKEKIARYAEGEGITGYYIRHLNSRVKYRRCLAAVILGYMPSPDVREALKSRIHEEKDYSVKLYIANSMADIADQGFLGPLISSLEGAPDWYRRKIKPMIMDFGSGFEKILPEILNSPLSEIQDLIIDYSSVHVSTILKEFLLDKSVSAEKEISYRAIETLCDLYLDESGLARYLSDRDPEIVRIAIRSAAGHIAAASVLQIIPMLESEEYYKDVLFSLSKIMFRENKFINLLIDEFHNSGSASVRKGLAEVLSEKIEYLLVKLVSDKTETTADLVKEIFVAGKVSSAIVFLNKNRDSMLENYVVPIIKSAAAQNAEVKIIFSANLNDRLMEKTGMERLPAPQPQGRKDYVKRLLLFAVLSAALFVFPAFFALTEFSSISRDDFSGILKLFIYRFNYYFVYYFIAVNVSYLVLLFFSYLGANRQARYWGIKHLRYLFKKNILPSISIIAPAFNEEANIIESVSSLLNLQYPDYEVIVVNDGSRDSTLHKLVDHFSLERADIDINRRINTARIRGIYVCRSIPNLVIVDKENGGKADSLNAGINVSRKEFFCGIDADSLLQSDSLLKLVSQFLDTDIESVAAGGNIFPVNGCTVEGGTLVQIGIPGNFFARLQFVEYIRAFMGGRVGWAYLHSLLIISGAFGVFNKEYVIEAGGYLTSRGRFGKDTVGEDMELVVRLALYMTEKKKPFRIHYACNANCWTEVPESYGILRRQRDRWHRGLLDIITFHKKMLFNPAFGRIGLIASPYYLIFEVAGPWIELQGYILFFVSLALGLISAKVFLMLFTASIMLGIFVTLSSFIIVEKEVDYFSNRDLLRLLLFALIESFGLRQALSLVRVSAFVNAILKAGGWGIMTRKGFVSAARKKT